MWRNENYKIQNCWINFFEPGLRHSTHVHGNSTISGVYYYKTNGNDGDLVIFNPNHNNVLNSWESPEIRIKPENGKLVLFPSYLYHEIETNTTQDTRISVAFNFREQIPKP